MMKLPILVGCLFPPGKGNANNKLRPEKFFPSCFRTGVRFPSAPPKQYNPNLVPIGHGFGFIVFIEEVEEW